MAERVWLADLMGDKEVESAIVNAGYEIAGGSSDLLSIIGENTRKEKIDFIVINTSSPSTQFFKIIHDVLTDNPCPIVVFTKSSTKKFTEDAANIGVAAYIIDGFVPARLKHIMQLASARYKEISALRSELEKTRSTLAERKIIEKAKGIIMKRKTIDEESAFQLMRKMAMDKNQKMSDVAKSIINVDTMLMS